MKPCSRHSHELLDQLKRRGLQRLIQPERAAYNAKAWLEGRASRQEFDPYVVAVMEIGAKARQFGADVLNGSCPLCEMDIIQHNAEFSASWIDNVSDLVLLVAKVNHLVA